MKIQRKPIRDTGITWEEDLVTYGGGFGRMEEKRRERRARGDGERRHYNTRPMGSAFRPHDSEGLGGVRNRKWVKEG